MRVALIGGTGFVGSYLVDALVAAGHEPWLLVRAGSEARVRHSGHCRTVTGDLTRPADLRQLLGTADAAIYNAGILRELPKRGITFEAIQYRGAADAIDAAVTRGLDRFLLMSANGARADGTAYQSTKFRAEEHLRASGLEHAIVRPSVIFGDPRGRDEFASRLYREMVRPPLPAVAFHGGLLPGRRPVRLSPVHVTDVADTFVRLLAEPAPAGRTVEIGGPEILTWKRIIERIAAATGRRKLVLPMPLGVMRAAATLLDRIPAFPVTRDQLDMLAEGNTADPGALRDLLGREPVAFDDSGLDYLGASRGA